MILKHLRGGILFTLFFLSVSLSRACDGSSISIASQVANPDGSVTYTLNCFVELGTLDLTFYGFVIKFNSPISTPTVVIGGTYPTTASLTTASLSSGSISGSLVAKTGAAINSVVNDSDWNVYDNQTNVISYESGELFGATSTSITFQIQVTVSGCAETILFDSSVNSGASQCEFTISTGNNCTPCTVPIPTLSAVTQPNCTTATGSFTITNYGSYSYTVTPSTGVTVTGNTITAPQGTYTVTASNGTCTSSASLSATVNAAPIVPATPALGNVTQPTCTVATGSFTITNYNGSLTYTCSPSTGVSFSTNTVTVPAGTYTITADNGTCSATSAQVVINAFTGSLAAPIIEAINQPTCTLATGSVDLSGLPSGSWTLTINPGASTVTGSGTTTTITSLAASTTYTFVVEDASGCVSSASSNAILNAQPSTPSAPGIGSITQPDCVANTGSVVLNGLPASGTWVLTSTPGSLTQTGTGTSTTFTGLTAGTTYTFTVENAAGCVSPASGNVVIDPLPSGPSAPTASVTIQPTCTSPTGTIVVNSPTGSSYEYSIDGSTYQASATFSSLSPGSYDVTVQDVNTLCVSSPTVLIVDPLPAGPSAPVASITAQPTCLDPFGTIQITSPTGANYEFSINGTPIPIGTYSVSNLDPSQTYGITVTDQTTGCSSSSFDVTINAVPSAAAVNAGPDLMIEAGDTVVLTATGVGTIIWENGDVSSTIVSPALTTTYTVTLTDANSCTSTDQVTVTVLDACGEVFIPTAFSPNGDALNSFFRIKVENECVVEMSLKVFDRWGEVIFEGIKADDSWDGTFKGKPLDSAVFVYTLDILLSNSSEHQLYSGNLTLIR